MGRHRFDRAASTAFDSQISHQPRVAERQTQHVQTVPGHRRPWKFDSSLVDQVVVAEQADDINPLIWWNRQTRGPQNAVPSGVPVRCRRSALNPLETEP